MSRYTRTKINRIFTTVPIYDKDGKATNREKVVRRVTPLPPQERDVKHFKGLPFPVLMSAGQIINLRKEYRRQQARLQVA